MYRSRIDDLPYPNKGWVWNINMQLYGWQDRPELNDKTWFFGCMEAEPRVYKEKTFVIVWLEVKLIWAVPFTIVGVGYFGSRPTPSPSDMIFLLDLSSIGHYLWSPVPLPPVLYIEICGKDDEIPPLPLGNFIGPPTPNGIFIPL